MIYLRIQIECDINIWFFWELIEKLAKGLI